MGERKRVTIHIIFRKVLELDPNFLGGVGSVNHMAKLKKWFYYGLKRREKFSMRKIVSVGQKLPPNWKEKLKHMHGRICMVQRP